MIIDVINKSGSTGGNFVGTATKFEPVKHGMRFVVTSAAKSGHDRHVTLAEPELYAIVEAAWKCGLLQNVSIG